MNKKELENRVAELEAENAKLREELRRLRVVCSKLMGDVHFITRYQILQSKLKIAE